LHSEIHATVRKGQDYLTFDAYLKAGVKVEMELCLNVEYNKTFKSAPKQQAAEKAGNGKGKAQ
jgi:hypothetical protein